LSRSADSHGSCVLLGEDISVTVEPDRGGRIASLVHLPTGREWLSQPAVPRVSSTYGSSFTEGEMAGWDEMIPTINACTYPGPGAAAGVSLPDHGEAWAVPWRVESSDGNGDLTLSVEGRALPYRLVRLLRIAGPAALTIEYRLDVLGDEPLAVLWACHPQLDCSPGTRLGLPAGVTEMLDVTDGAPGTPVAYPGHGPLQVGLLPCGTGRKLVAPPEARVAEVDLRDPEGTWLRMRWDTTSIPYFGIWLDNRSLSRVPVAVIEPTDGYFDSLELAASTGHAAITEPGSPRRWALTVELGQTSPSSWSP
jgi:hypothetical protein